MTFDTFFVLLKKKTARAFKSVLTKISFGRQISTEGVKNAKQMFFSTFLKAVKHY